MGSYRQVRNSAGDMGWARKIPFTYIIQIPVGGLANLASASNSIQTDPGLPFILTEMGGAYSLDITNSTAFENRLNFTLLDGESQQNLSNGPVPRERMFGTRDFPRQLPEEVQISTADLLTLTVTNNTGGAIAAGATFTGTLTGFKLVGFTRQKPE
jgi:hypothetical protein